MPPVLPSRLIASGLSRCHVTTPSELLKLDGGGSMVPRKPRTSPGDFLHGSWPPPLRRSFFSLVVASNQRDLNWNLLPPTGVIGPKLRRNQITLFNSHTQMNAGTPTMTIGSKP